jgi:hypothetical protein
MTNVTSRDNHMPPVYIEHPRYVYNLSGKVVCRKHSSGIPF